jgi:t-SNARE complex subunit (syntaxin)
MSEIISFYECCGEMITIHAEKTTQYCKTCKRIMTYWQSQGACEMNAALKYHRKERDEAWCRIVVISIVVTALLTAVLCRMAI